MQFVVSLKLVMLMEPTAGKLNPEDIASSSGGIKLNGPAVTEAKVAELEQRVVSLERLIMRMLDKLELDYPGIV